MSVHLLASPVRLGDGAVTDRRGIDPRALGPSSAPTSVAYPRVRAAHQLPAAVIDTLVEQQPAAVLVADRDGRLVYRNEAARRLAADVAESVRWALTRAVLTEECMRDRAFQLASPDGRPRRFDLRVTPVRDEAGRVAGAVLTLADVTAASRMAQWEPVIESLMNL